MKKHLGLLTEREKEPVITEISRVAFEFLKSIAEEDGISIAHALDTQLSGWGVYDFEKNRIEPVTKSGQEGG